jgi:hypothetical protein
VCDATITCGVNNVNLFEGDTLARQHIATDLFGDDFATCMDNGLTELDCEFKTYSELTILQGQICLLPEIKGMIKIFVQWDGDERRIGRDPSTRAFPVADTPNSIRCQKTHAQFVKISSTLSDAAKPAKFTSKTTWTDWAPSFLN